MSPISVREKPGWADIYTLRSEEYASFVNVKAAFCLILGKETGSREKYEALSHESLYVKGFRTLV